MCAFYLGISLEDLKRERYIHQPSCAALADSCHPRGIVIVILDRAISLQRR
jgi:hypothetical protein